MTTSNDAYWSPKFGHDPFCEALWTITLDGGQDDQAGEADSTGWYGLIHFDHPEGVEISTGRYVYVPQASYIVVQVSTGAVGYETWPLRGEEILAAWEGIESFVYGNDEGVLT